MDRACRAVILGSGRVATHLARALAGVADVVQIWSRDKSHAQILANKIGSSATDDIGDVVRDADLYIISVSDDAVASVARELGPVDGIVAHTSGSIPLEALSPTPRHAVFYPLQTFGTDRPLTLEGVPLFTEATDSHVEEYLHVLARNMGMRPRHADSALRARLHLAAVFACNFANRMWTEAENLLARDNLTLDIFRPLLEETLHKALAEGAANSQTGPAARHDTGVIERQAATLDGDRRRLYELVSKMIMDSPNQQHHEQDKLPAAPHPRHCL